MNAADGSKILVAGISNDSGVWFAPSDAFVLKDDKLWVDLRATAYARPNPVEGARFMIDRRGEKYYAKIPLLSVRTGTPTSLHVRAEFA